MEMDMWGREVGGSHGGRMERLRISMDLAAGLQIKLVSVGSSSCCYTVAQYWFPVCIEAEGWEKWSGMCLH